MLARRHKSWKHHFGVRLRAVDPFCAALVQAVPRLLDDARTRGSAPNWQLATACTFSSRRVE
jgi:hypothetical protein